MGHGNGDNKGKPIDDTWKECWIHKICFEKESQRSLEEPVISNPSHHVIDTRRNIARYANIFQMECRLPISSISKVGSVILVPFFQT